MSEPTSNQSVVVAGADDDLIRRCVEMRGALRGAQAGAQAEVVTWWDPAVSIIRTPAATDDGIIAKYNLLQDIQNQPLSPEFTRVFYALDCLLKNDLRRSNRDWRWLRLSPQRKKHKDFWEHWQRSRERDRKWLSIKVIADFITRFPDPWRRIYDAIAANAFSVDGKSRVFLVHPGYACWRISPERLARIPDQKWEDIEKNCLFHCWLPYEVAAKWLVRFGIRLAEAIDPPTVARIFSEAAAQPTVTHSASRVDPAVGDRDSQDDGRPGEDKPDVGGQPQRFNRGPFDDAYRDFRERNPGASVRTINAHMMIWSKDFYREPDYLAPPSP